MPRQPRYFLPGYAQHVILRGVDRQATFFAPQDYRLFCRVLGKAASKHGCAIHAYVLMTNHVHLLLTPDSKRALPQVIQALGRSYVQTINRRYDRTGTLWQGRYKACLVQPGGRLLQCQRYIELNPVRAGMVTDPGDYPYSSYRSNALGRTDALLTPHDTYLDLQVDPATRLNLYRQQFGTELDSNVLTTIRETTNSCLVLGNDRFKDQIERLLNRSVRPKKGGRPAAPRRA